MTAMDPATIQGVMHRLMGRGLPERRPDKNHRRRVLLSLTEAGRALVEAINERVVALDGRIPQRLARSEREQFFRLLKRVA